MSVQSVRLNPKVEEGLETAARKLKRSKGWIINQALAEFLERYNREQRRWHETLAAMESVAQGKIVSADKVHDWLGSWGSPEELSPPQSDS